MPNCKCHNRMDIQARCSFKNKDFKYCNARIDTLYFHFENDYCSYKFLENDPNNYKKIINMFCKSYINNKDINKLIEFYEEEHEIINIDEHIITDKCKSCC